MDYYEIAKIVLVLSASFAILGMSIQFVRLLQEAILIVKSTRKGVGELNEFVVEIKDDYLNAKNSILSVGSGFKGFSKSLSGLSLVMGAVGYLIKMFAKDKSEE